MKKPRSPTERLLASVLIAASLAAVSAAEVDLHRRPAVKVRGDKRIWRVVCLNALGALAYFLFGRAED